MKKISLPFFVSENLQKSGFQKYNHFLKKFFRQILKENVIKVPKVKLYEHPEVFKKLNTEEMLPEIRQSGSYIPEIILSTKIFR